MNIKFMIFSRLCSRILEIVQAQGAPQVLVDVFQESAAQPLQAFEDANESVKSAKKRMKDASKGKEATLSDMDRLFRMGRSAVAVVVPTTELPATLKAQATDTDRRNAIQSLMTTLQTHAGATWADNLLQGDLGQNAPIAVDQLNEYIAAANALQKAKADRLSAFGPAWSAYVGYKRLVRDTLGSSSREYQGLRYRKVSGDTSDGDHEVDDSAGDEIEVEDEEHGANAAPEVAAATKEVKAAESVPVPSVHQ